MQVSWSRAYHREFVRPVRATAYRYGGSAYGTWLLVVGMILVMAGALAMGWADYQSLVDDHGLSAAGWSWADAHAYGQLLSYAFLHGSAEHFFWNTLILLLVGCVIEWRMGFRVVTLIFIAGAIASGLAHLLIFPHETRVLIGASGGVSALLGAALVLVGDLGVQVRVPGTPRWFTINLRWLLLAWLGLQFISLVEVIASDGGAGEVAYWGHTSGFVIGAALALVLRLIDADGHDQAAGGDLAPTFSSAGD